jgi:hypothetical protein
MKSWLLNFIIFLVWDSGTRRLSSSHGNRTCRQNSCYRCCAGRSGLVRICVSLTHSSVQGLVSQPNRNHEQRRSGRKNAPRKDVHSGIVTMAGVRSPMRPLVASPRRRPSALFDHPSSRFIHLCCFRGESPAIGGIMRRVLEGFHQKNRTDESR